MSRSRNVLIAPLLMVGCYFLGCTQSGTMQVLPVSLGRQSLLPEESLKCSGRVLMETYDQWNEETAKKLWSEADSTKSNDTYPCPTTKQKMRTWIHYHIQHNAGTALWKLARSNGECAPRICQQRLGECFVSYNETEEARVVSQSKITYMSYEAMLPRYFPMPFVYPDIRKSFYFTTIVRDPIERLKSTLRTKKFADGATNWRELFYSDFNRPTTAWGYHADNLIVRWLAGVTHIRPVTNDDVNIAKCRLKAFDLVMTDTTISKAVPEILCPQRKMLECKNRPTATQHTGTKADPLEKVDPIAIGAWIERHRPSYDVYDYAEHLAHKQLKERKKGGNAIPTQTPPLSSGVVKAFSKYLGINGTYKVPRLPKEQWEPDCDEIFQIWSSGPSHATPKLTNALGSLGAKPALASF